MATSSITLSTVASSSGGGRLPVELAKTYRRQLDRELRGVPAADLSPHQEALKDPSSGISSLDFAHYRVEAFMQHLSDNLVQEIHGRHQVKRAPRGN